MITRQPDKGFSRNPRVSVFIDGVHVAEVEGSRVNLRNGDKRVKPWDRNRGHLTPGQRGRAYTVRAVTDAAKAWKGCTGTPPTMHGRLFRTCTREGLSAARTWLRLHPRNTPAAVPAPAGYLPFALLTR